MGGVEAGKCQNRHMEFVQSIFVDISKQSKPEEIYDLAATLDELLTGIFDEEE